MEATENDLISFPCLQLEQPIGFFYVGVVDARDLVDIAWMDVQRFRDLDSFLGIERPLSADRVRELQKYVSTVDATFPTGVIVAVSSEDAEYDENAKVMRIVRRDSVAKIIDGQHRIAGLKAFPGRVFQINLTVFVDMDLEDQAMVFATINLKQRPVSKSLAYNLYEYATKRSPQRTCHDLAKLLNNKEGSPFEDKIKILGTATPGKKGETLTQAAFVENLLPLISEDPDRDRETLKNDDKLQAPRGAVVRRLIFWEFFRQDRDEAIGRVVWNYFASVRRRWPNAWLTAEKGLVLNRTTGLAALMRLLPSAYHEIDDPDGIPSETAFLSIFERSNIEDIHFTADRYVPGSSGQKRLYDTLKESTGLEDQPGL